MTATFSKAHHGTVVNGRMQFDDRAAFQAAVDKLEGKDVTVTIGRKRHPRTLKQQAWWRMCVGICADEAGYDMDERDTLHYWLLRECFGEHYDERIQCKVPNVTHLSDTDTVSCSEAIEWLPRFAAKWWGVVLPDPKDVA